MDDKATTASDRHEQDRLSEKDKVQILLAEYNTLRAEILTRHTAGFQLVAIGSAIITWLATQEFGPKPLIFLLIFAITIACSLWVLFADIRRIGKRICQIEEEVNRRAAEPLLIWENRWGGNRVGVWRRLSRVWGPDPAVPD